MREWTVDQKNAIDARSGNVLVTAAAGSGKTSVLTERVLRIVYDDRVDIDRLLIVTFTRAAASEMKERISTGLSELVALHPTDKFLARQKFLLSNANINTVDGFCSSLIRENFKLADVDCNYRLLEEGEFDFLKSESLNEVLDVFFEKKSKDFIMLVDMFSKDNNYSGLNDCLLKLYSFLSANDDRYGWLQNMVSLYEDNNAIKLWEDLQHTYVLNEICKCRDLIEDACRSAREDDAVFDAYGDVLSLDCDFFDYVKSCGEENLLQSFEIIRNYKFKSLKPAKNCNEYIKKRTRQLHDEYKDIVQNLRSGILKYTSDVIQQDMNSIKPIVSSLAEVMRCFITHLDEKKRSTNTLSIDDLEQKALSLLINKDNNGNICYSEFAQNKSMEFHAILVDEYQDTNPAQALIFNALSCENNNLFMVGDIKQAIYGFRHSSTDSFAKRKDSFALYDEEKPVFPARIALSSNFRSRPEITDYVNHIFELCCSTELGGTEYDETEKLFPKAVFADKPEDIYPVELHFLDNKSCEVEARLIARRIDAIIKSGEMIKDGDTCRPVCAGDIVVLCRSVKRIVTYLKQNLNEFGIDLNMSGESTFLSQYEIVIAVSMLRVIDNPYQDIPLATVMISPLFSFTTDELAKIRLQSRKTQLYAAVKEYVNATGDKKTASFINIIDKLRREAATQRVDIFLLNMYNSMSIPAILSAYSSGKTATANLNMLMSYATKSAANGNVYLSSFLRYLDMMINNGKDLKSPTTNLNNGVRLMSIHKSKGLQFPIVILADIHKFNDNDAKEKYMFHSSLGFGGRVRRENIYYNTLQRELVIAKKNNDMQSEELRILYVALTRAIEKLVIFSSISGLQSKIINCSTMQYSDKYAKCRLQDASSFNDWLLYSAFVHPDGECLASMVDVPFVPVKEVRSRACISIDNVEMVYTSKENALSQHISDDVFDDMIDDNCIQAAFSWIYPYEDSLNIPSKVSASGIAHSAYISRCSSVVPSFSNNKELTGAEKGTFIHRLMSLYDYGSNLSVKAQAEALAGKDVIDSKHIDAVDIEQCETFVLSDIGKRIAKASLKDQLLREYPFCFRVDASNLPGFDSSMGKIMINGIADLIFFETNKIIIVDFKTDKNVNEDELVRRYSLQLRLYRQAAVSLWNANEVDTFIWSFSLNKLISIV